MKRERPLSYREKRFVDLYAVSGKGRQSAIDAGYSVKGADQAASRLLSRGRIKEAIEALRPQYIKPEEMVTPAYVIAGLQREAETADQASARIQAYTQLGRALGMFVDRQQTMISTTYADELESLQDDIKAAIAAVPTKKIASD